MERQEFLRLLSTAGVAVCAGCTLESCSKSDSPTPNNPGGGGSTTVDFTIDLSDSANAALITDGGFAYKSGIIVVCLNASTKTFTAVSQTCTHQGFTIGFDAANGNFLCTNHGSRFSTAGTVVNGPATINLRKYNTSVSGNILRVFS